jgi:hypothetical protein
LRSSIASNELMDSSFIWFVPTASYGLSLPGNLILLLRSFPLGIPWSAFLLLYHFPIY